VPNENPTTAGASPQQIRSGYTVYNKALLSIYDLMVPSGDLKDLCLSNFSLLPGEKVILPVILYSTTDCPEVRYSRPWPWVKKPRVAGVSQTAVSCSTS
jgi:hypothetical protein